MRLIQVALAATLAFALNFAVYAQKPAPDASQSKNPPDAVVPNRLPALSKTTPPAGSDLLPTDGAARPTEIHEVLIFLYFKSRKGTSPKRDSR